MSDSVPVTARHTPSTQLTQPALIEYLEPAQLPEHDRPVPRVLRDGVLACNTVELLQALIGGPPTRAELIARDLLARFPTLTALRHASVPDLMGSTLGLGQATAVRLKVALELGRRLMLQPDPDRLQIKTPADAAQVFMAEMGLLEQEEIRTMLLDSRNRVMGPPRMIYRGTLNSAGMRIGELFREAIRHNAASIIVAHNHPSCDPSPSSEDIRVTKSIVQAGQSLDIEVLDHLVIARNSYVSLKERSLGFDT